MDKTAEQVAREVQDEPWARGLARAGIAASGVVHALLGIIVLVVATGGDGEADQAGAFTAIGAAPVGFVVLWVLAIALWALGVWEVLAGLRARGTDARRTWGARITAWGRAALYVTLGAIAAAVALGARPDGDESAEKASSTLLQLPGGPFILGLVGIGVGVGGIAFAVIGIRGGFLKLVRLPPAGAGLAVRVLGTIGYIAKGVALAIVGVLLLVAAATVDPEAAGGLDGAVEALIALPLGPLLAGAVGVGLLSYAVFLFLRTRYARL